MNKPTPEIRMAMTQPPHGRSPVMYQRWTNLLFLHWAVAPDTIQATLPPGLTVDTYNDQAWLGVVPFFMQGLRPRFCPPVPGLSNFLELNLRTYVHDDKGRPGVWFYSLDANQALAVKIAQLGFSLPYVHAQIASTVDAEGGIEFRSTRRGQPVQEFHYKPVTVMGTARPGTLEFFLVERYLLFSHQESKNRLYMGRIHHKPYPLVEPELPAYSRDLFPLNGFADPARAPDHALMSHGVDVAVYGLQRIA